LREDGFWVGLRGLLVRVKSAPSSCLAFVKTKLSPNLQELGDIYN